MTELKYRILSIIIGVVFFIASIYVTISVLNPIFGCTLLGFNFSRLGYLLFSTYKFSSFLIPVILLYASILLLIPGWSRESKAIILGTPIYFITSLLGEYIIYNFIPKISNMVVRDFANITIVLCVCLLFLLEVVASIMIAEKNNWLYIKVEKNTITEDIIGDDYIVIEENIRTEIVGQILNSEDKIQSDVEKEELHSASVVTHEQFLKTGIANTPELYESIKAFDEIKPDINVDIGGNLITEKKAPLIDSLVVIENSDIKSSNGLELNNTDNFGLDENNDDIEYERQDAVAFNDDIELNGATSEDGLSIANERVANENFDAIEESENIEIISNLDDIKENLNEVDDNIHSYTEEIVDDNSEDLLKDETTINDEVNNYAEYIDDNQTNDIEEYSDDDEIDNEEENGSEEEFTADEITDAADEIIDEDDDDDEYSKIEVTAAQPLQPKFEPKIKGYHIPYDLLTKYPGNEYWLIDDSTKAAAIALKNTFAEFSINIEITGIRKGPVVTMFEVLPPPGIKLAKITALQDNIALRLAAQSVRIVAPIPGKQAVGIEVPNKNRAIVGFRELIETEIPDTKKMGIPVVLGKDVTGEPQTLDLCQTPHLLIAGATGSGKSVCVNSIILSILYNKSPDQVKLLLVDPKIVELKLYNGIAHLLTPVITEPKRALQGLQYCIYEMERRYAMLDGLSVRDIKSYNKKIKREKLVAEFLPYIVIVIDEFADLMATTGKELESTVSRLCAMSRAVGIHLVLATQRPSTNVITGLIKANIPSRIAFMVASRVDSQIILDNNGAEKLLGRGDMLYISTTKPFPSRIQGTFVSDEEVEQVVECVKTFGEPEYIDDQIFFDDEEDDQRSVFDDESDPLYEEALQIVLAEGKASASYIQRRLKIGYNRAARIVEEMEDRGVVGPANGSKPREVITNM